MAIRFSKDKFLWLQNGFMKKKNWNEDYKWFLLDEGKIHYAFKNKLEAKVFRDEFFLSYMFLTDLENIIPDTMVDPNEYRSWINKETKCIYRNL